MKTLEQLKKDFFKRDIEFKTGKKQEDWNEYLTNQKLEHLKIKNLNNDDFQEYLLNQNLQPYLSETQKADINRDNNQLNSMGMMMGISVPLTLASIYGVNKLMNNRFNTNNHIIRETILNNRYERTTNNMGESLSGVNNKHMPIADRHLTDNTVGGLFPSYLTSEPAGLFPPKPDSNIPKNLDEIYNPPYAEFPNVPNKFNSLL